MPGLAGVTAWVGKPGTRQIIRSGPLGNVSCCQPSGTQSTLFAAGEETCGVVPEGGGGGFCPMSGSLWSSPDCNPTFVPDADFRAELEEFYNTNMINWAVPSLGRTLLISSPKGVETVPMRRNGAPLVTMVATSDRGYHEQLASLWAPGQPGFHEVNAMSMAFNGSLFCGVCDAVAYCGNEPDFWKSPHPEFRAL